MMLNKFLKRINVEYILWSILIALAFLFIKGYQFNSGDQAEHLPQVYKLINPALYKGDFFMSYYQGAFTVRFFYVWMMYILSFIAPIAFWSFTLTVLSISFAVYGTMRIARFFSNDIISPFIAPILIFVIFYDWTIGGNNITYNTFICSTIAKGFGIWSFYEYFRGKYYRSTFSSAIATLFQVMVGAQVFFLILILILFRKKEIKWSKLFNSIIIYMLFSSAMLIPMIYKQLFSGSVYDQNLYNSIIFDFRNPGHFIPSSFPISDYIRFFFLIIIAVISSIKLNLPNTGSLIRLIIISISGMLLFTIGIEIMGIYGVAKTQWFKTSIWVAALSCIPLSILVSINVRKILSHNLIFKFTKPIAVAGIICFSSVILFSKSIPIPQIQGRYQVGYFERSDLSKMHHWIKQNTPQDALFLVAPDNTSFGCEAQRSTIANFKAIIHEPWFMLPWYSRIRETYCVELSDLGKGQLALELAVKNYSTRNCIHEHPSLKVNYRLDNRSECKFMDQLGELIHDQGDWVLTKVE